MPERFYNLQQVATKLQTTRMTLRTWLHDAGMETVINPRNKKEHLLSQAQLEHLAHLKKITLAPDTPKPADPLAALESRLRAYVKQEITAQVGALREDILARLEALEVPLAPQPQQIPASAPAPVASATTDALEGTAERERVLFLPFLHAHFDEEDAAPAFAAADSILSSRQRYQSISPKQRARLIRAWRDLPGFGVCGQENCPCGEG